MTIGSVPTYLGLWSERGSRGRWPARCSQDQLIRMWNDVDASYPETPQHWRSTHMSRFIGIAVTLLVLLGSSHAQEQSAAPSGITIGSDSGDARPARGPCVEV